MIQRLTYSLTFSSLILYLFSSCAGTRSYDLKPVLYQDNFEVFHRVVHKSQDSSILLLDVDSDNYSVSLFIYDDIKKSRIVHKQESIIKGKSKKAIGILFPSDPPRFHIEVAVRDNEKGKVFRTVIATEKSNPNEWFTLLDEGKPVLRPYTDLNKTLQLYNYKNRRMWVTYMAKAFLPASPPFSERGFYLNPHVGYIDRISLASEGKVKLEGAGLYFIQADTSRNDGFFISVFEKGFPKINYVNQMVAPLRYITTSYELTQIATSKNVKEDVDAFWLNRSSDRSYAKNILKEYYKRVEQANISFTTYKEGWKTDRGMALIVFGKPDKIRLSPKAEIWIYNATTERKSIRLEFLHKDNQYILNRWEDFRLPWNVEVYEWRKGLISD